MGRKLQTGLNLVQYGPARCGTTFIWQILKYIDAKYLPTPPPPKSTGVAKVHDYVITDLPIIGCVRNFKDAYISYAKVGFHGKKVISNNPTKKELSKYKDYEKNYLHDLQKYKNHKNILWLRYEDFNNNSDYVVNKVSKFLNIEITEEDRNIIREEFSIEKNKEISNNLKHFTNVDKPRKLHGNHITANKPGEWKRFLPKNLHKELNFLNKYLIEWGYETD